MATNPTAFMKLKSRQSTRPPGNQGKGPRKWLAIGAAGHPTACEMQKARLSMSRHVKTILFALSPLVLKDWGNKDRQSNDFETLEEI
jgi:hypothetical protein